MLQSIVSLLICTAALLQPSRAEPPASPATAATQPSSPAAASQPATDASKPTFEQRLTTVDEKMVQVKDLRAQFEQRKKTALLKKPLVSSGSLVCKGESVLWKTTSPRASSMLVEPTKVTVYYPQDKLAEEYDVGARFRDAAGGPLPRLSKLKERFEIAELTPDELKALGMNADDMKDRVGVKLTPKGEDLRKYVASVRVILDTTVPCADRVIIADPDGDETEIRFSAVRINTEVSDADLALKLPEGTRVSRPTGGK